MIHNPGFFINLGIRIPGIINRRIQHSVDGEKVAHDIF